MQTNIYYEIPPEPKPQNNKSSEPAQAQGRCETRDCERGKEVKVDKGLLY